MTLNSRSRSPKPNHLFIMSQCYIHANLVEICQPVQHTSTFWLKFGSLSPAVTLKLRSRPPKPNQLVIMSQCYIHANLVKIHPPVHEISYKQESVTPTPTPKLTPTPTGSTPKTICPPYLWWETKILKSELETRSVFNSRYPIFQWNIQVMHCYCFLIPSEYKIQFRTGIKYLKVKSRVYVSAVNNSL